MDDSFYRDAGWKVRLRAFGTFITVSIGPYSTTFTYEQAREFAQMASRRCAFGDDDPTTVHLDDGDVTLTRAGLALVSDRLFHFIKLAEQIASLTKDYTMTTPILHCTPETYDEVLEQALARITGAVPAIVTVDFKGPPGMVDAFYADLQARADEHGFEAIKLPHVVLNEASEGDAIPDEAARDCGSRADLSGARPMPLEDDAAVYREVNQEERDALNAELTASIEARDHAVNLEKAAAAAALAARLKFKLALDPAALLPEDWTFAREIATAIEHLDTAIADVQQEHGRKHNKILARWDIAYGLWPSIEARDAAGQGDEPSLVSLFTRYTPEGVAEHVTEDVLAYADVPTRTVSDIETNGDLYPVNPAPISLDYEDRPWPFNTIPDPQPIPAMYLSSEMIAGMPEKGEEQPAPLPGLTQPDRLTIENLRTFLEFKRAVFLEVADRVGLRSSHKIKILDQGYTRAIEDLNDFVPAL